MNINIFAPIVPNASLGGLVLHAHLSEIDELVSGLGVLTPGYYELVSPYEARYYFEEGAVQAAIDVRNGRIFKLIASKSYRGRFGLIHVGMSVRDAMAADPRLYYDEGEEYILCRGVDGITMTVPAVDPDPSQVLQMWISDIAVHVIEIETIKGQAGHWHNELS